MVSELERKDQLIKSILDKVNCVGDLDDQLMKLYCLFKCCAPSYQKEDGEEFLSKGYIQEKMGRVMQGVPISLGEEGNSMYLKMRLGVINEKDRD